MTKSVETGMDHSMAKRGMVQPWDDESKHEVTPG